jgi:hypothetical protein
MDIAIDNGIAACSSLIPRDADQKIMPIMRIL